MLFNFAENESQIFIDPLVVLGTVNLWLQWRVIVSYLTKTGNRVAEMEILVYFVLSVCAISKLSALRSSFCVSA